MDFALHLLLRFFFLKWRTTFSFSFTSLDEIRLNNFDRRIVKYFSIITNIQTIAFRLAVTLATLPAMAYIRPRVINDIFLNFIKIGPVF